MLLVLRETYPVKILELKARRLQKETGNHFLRSKLDLGLSPKHLFWRTLVRPLKLLFRSPIVVIFSSFMAIVYGYLYLMFTTLTSVFTLKYGFSQGNVGLVYLGLGTGMLFGLFLFGLVSDMILKRLSVNGETKPEYRLPPLIPGSFFIPIGLFIYGWTAQYHVFWFVPIFGTSLVGIGLIATFVSHNY